MKPGKDSGSARSAVIGHGPKGHVSSTMRAPTVPLSDKQKALLARKLAYAYSGGIPIKRAFELMLEESRSRNLRLLARDIANAIECGYSLEEALRAQGGALDAFFVDLVAAGERAGRLSDALDALSAWYEEQLAFSRMLSYQFSYYIVLFVVIGFFLYPCIDVFLKGASPMLLVHAAVRFAVFASIVCAMHRFGGVRWLRQRFGAHAWPFSNLTRAFNLSRFCRVLALTYGHLSFRESWSRAAESVWDHRVRGHLMRVPDRVREGATLAQAVAECPALPTLVKDLIITGENTGNTGECFLKASEYLRKEAMHKAHILSLALGTAIVIGLMMPYAFGVGFALGSLLAW